jgi:hypothetical protein
MHKKIILTSLFAAIFATSFSQDKSSNDSTKFAKGVYLEKMDFTFPWIFDIKEISNRNFKNLTITTKNNRKWVNIKFDSTVFLNGILLNKVIVFGVKKKQPDEDKYEMSEFRSIVSADGIESVAQYFKYNWKGWKTISAIPYYQILLLKRKKYNYIIIRKVSPR